jgi:hypothetical protein
MCVCVCVCVRESVCVCVRGWECLRCCYYCMIEGEQETRIKNQKKEWRIEILVKKLWIIWRNIICFVCLIFWGQS